MAVAHANPEVLRWTADHAEATPLADSLGGNADGYSSHNPDESGDCLERPGGDSVRSVVGVDFFSGCGGTSLGFSQAGISPVLAIDNDPEAAATYRANFPDAEYIESDIRDVKTAQVEAVLEQHRDALRVFAGCAPCQPFSSQQKNRDSEDERAPLLLEFLRFIEELQPDVFFVENVPGLQRMADVYGPFHEFTSSLEDAYELSAEIVASAAYGVPQSRRRLVIVGSRHGCVGMPHPTHGSDAGRPYSTVREWIAGLPAIRAGQVDDSVPSHRAAALSDRNLERIRETPEGGDRRDWPSRLVLRCHRGCKGYTDVYGRMKWDGLAPALTTKCTSYSNGRFGHPEQHRAISVREAALLQTFPMEFEFKGSWVSQTRQIGNAVPVLLARRFGSHIVSHLMRASR